MNDNPSNLNDWTLTHPVLCGAISYNFRGFEIQAVDGFECGRNPTSGYWLEKAPHTLGCWPGLRISIPTRLHHAPHRIIESEWFSMQWANGSSSLCYFNDDLQVGEVTKRQ